MIGISIVSVIILLGVLIFAHECGHFLVAKATGVGVLKFSLGFGPRIVGKKIGETEYLLSLIPLGGYVKLLGDTAAEALSPEEEKRSFLRQPVGKRIAIVAAGPLFNFVLAIGIFLMVFMAGIPVLTSRLGTVQPESAAAAAGLQPDDRILAVDGRGVSRWDAMAAAIQRSEGRPLTVAVERGGRRLEVPVQPRPVVTKNLFGEDVTSFKIGVSPAGETVIERLNPGAALWASLQKTWAITELTLVSLVKIVQGIVSPRTLGGPILIAQIAGAQVKEGLVPFVLFMALLSINLAVLNLLPIPILDGGHLLFFLIEAVFRREVNVKWREMAQQVGFVLLVLLMIFVFLVDIERLDLKIFQDASRLFTR